MSRSTPWRTARKMYNLSGGLEWYRIRNQADGPTQLFIYDEIGYFGVGASDLVHDLSDVKGPIEVHINSPGGEVWDGITIYNTLMQRRDVSVVIDGMAASIASVIACAGSPTVIAKQGQMVIHEGFTMSIGNAKDMRETADRLDRASNTIASIYADRTGKSDSYWRELMRAETTYSGEEAVQAGLADKILEQPSRAAMPKGDWDLDGLMLNAASVPYVGREQHRHAPMTGRHIHDHAAFEAADHDDGVHYHHHNHNNDSDHHHSHIETPPGSGIEVHGDHARDATDWSLLHADLMNHVLDHRFTDIENWDAAAALAKCKTAADFRSICAGEHNKGEPDTSEHWALPHHNSPGAGPDKGGVVAALGRWNQTQGLKNKDAALAHLKAHARALGLPSGDGDSGQVDEPRWEEPTEEEVEQFIEALKGAKE